MADVILQFHVPLLLRLWIHFYEMTVLCFYKSMSGMCMWCVYVRDLLWLETNCWWCSHALCHDAWNYCKKRQVSGHRFSCSFSLCLAGFRTLFVFCLRRFSRLEKFVTSIGLSIKTQLNLLQNSLHWELYKYMGSLNYQTLFCIIFPDLCTFSFNLFITIILLFLTLLESDGKTGMPV